MTRPTPVAIPDPALPLPDPADRATFSARKLEHLRWAAEDMAPGAEALAQVAKDNADDAYASAGAAAADAASAAANTALTALYAGAVLWVSGATYALGIRVISTVNGLVYRKTTATAGGAVDPSANTTDWTIQPVQAPTVIVTGTTQTAVAGYEYVLTNVAATTVTLPGSPVSGDKVIVKPANALATNVINPNGATIEGVSGNMTIDNAFAVVNLQHLNSSWRLV